MNESRSTLINEDLIDIKKIAAHLYEKKWIILIAACIGAVIAFLHTLSIEPLYQTSSLLEIHTNQSGQSAMLSRIGILQNENSELDIEEALIKTRYILEPVIKNLGLSTSITPRYFPIFGQWYARHHKNQSLAKPFLNLKSYAWGGEIIELKNFYTTNKYTRQSFQIIAGKNGTYSLLSNTGNLIITGKEGEGYFDQKSGIQLEIKKIIAHPGTIFTLNYSPPVLLVNKLANKIKISDISGNDSIRRTGIIQIQLIDSDPDMAIKTLDKIIHYIIIRDTYESYLSTKKNLEFINQKLPGIKKSLEDSENILNQYHIKNETLSISLKSQMLINRISDLEKSIDELRTQRNEFLQIYTIKHPLVIATSGKEGELQKELNKAKEDLKKLPFMNQYENNLVRDIKIKNATYSTLLNTRNQLELSQGSSPSHILILSDPTPPNELPNQKLLLIIMGCGMGMFLAAFLFTIQSIFTHTVDDHEEIENHIGVPVKTVVPFCQYQRELEKLNKHQLSGKPISNSFILANQLPNDPSIESLRSLRINLDILKPQEGTRTITIMGSAPNIGKSFVSINLAQVLADGTDKKTLLVDADIRKGLLHNMLAQSKSPGLSEYLEGKCNYESIIKFIHRNLYFIPCGMHNEHPLKLFQGHLFKQLIEKIKHDYDQVIIDTPPILLVSDAILISQHTEHKLYVVGGAKDTLKAVRQGINKIRVHGIGIDGVIFNHCKPISAHGKYGYGYAYSYYSYTNDKKPILNIGKVHN